MATLNSNIPAGPLAITPAFNFWYAEATFKPGNNPGSESCFVSGLNHDDSLPEKP